MECGLLGRKLSHSYSPQIHSFFGDYSYALCEVEPDDLDDFFHNLPYQGINVTIPYKKAVIPYCDELTQVAAKMSAVNTIVRRSDGKLVGHNTDYFGFLSTVIRSGLQVTGKKVLVLGSGGAANTAIAVMKELGGEVITISRSGPNHYGNLFLHDDAAVIVNATPVGMYPNNGQSPVDLSLFPKLEGVLDMIYNPARTQLIMDARERNLVAENGLWMLIAQAKESAEWFTGNKIPDNIIQKIHTHLSAEMQNIVLIGMPGCGKTTIGTLLSKATDRRFVDTDALIVEKAGCSIPELFQNKGENYFRYLESQILNDVGKESGIIISTGGGCVTRKENYPALHQNSTIIWLKRDVNLLPSNGRPLSQSTCLTDMYRTREPLYAQFADIIVENSTTPAETMQTIRRLQ